MRISFNKVKCESIMDPINYITLGMAPSSKNVDLALKELERIWLDEGATADVANPELYTQDDVNTMLKTVASNIKVTQKKCLGWGIVAMIATGAVGTLVGYEVGQNGAYDRINRYLEDHGYHERVYK